MKVLEIKNIEKKEHPILYRRSFQATAVLEVLHNPIERTIEFTVEHTPLGKREIQVRLIEPVEYPLLPLLRELRHHISHLDKTGGLP
ncbi:MAG: hypothetical protein N2509_03495 [Treponemataceae bacterium]|nr:hypothetical protein [Treponemataceae bacterium]